MKAKMLATSAMCAAIATICMWVAGLPIARWFVLILAAFASVATAVPMLIDASNTLYSVLIYLVSASLGTFLGWANIVYVAPIVVFCMPFALVKAYGDSVKVRGEISHVERLEDPFDSNNDRNVVRVEINGRKRLPTAVKWILYYVLLELALAATVLLAYFLFEDLFTQMYAQKWLFWVVIAIAQAIVPAYDLLLRGCFVAARKAIRHAFK